MPTITDTGNFAKMICNARKRMNLSVFDACVKLNVQIPSLYAYEKGHTLPNSGRLQSFVDLYKLDPKTVLRALARDCK